MIEEVILNDRIFAIIIRNNYYCEGVNFFTPDVFSQQLSYMHHRKGKIIEAHIHNHLPREVFLSQEVLFIKKGKLKVDFYTDDRAYFDSRVIEAGDVILLAAGGHGFEVLDDIEMIEVKQGPYLGVQDKVKF